MIVGKKGQPAYYDGLTGLSPCIVTEFVTEERLGILFEYAVVDFDDSERVLHWSGVPKNPWRGRKGEVVPLRNIIPAKAVTRNGTFITHYRWEK